MKGERAVDKRKKNWGGLQKEERRGTRFTLLMSENICAGRKKITPIGREPALKKEIDPPSWKGKKNSIGDRRGGG